MQKTRTSSSYLFTSCLLALCVCFSSLGCVRQPASNNSVEKAASGTSAESVAAVDDADDAGLFDAASEDDATLADDVLADIAELDDLLAEGSEDESDLIAGGMSPVPANQMEFGDGNAAYRLVNLALSQLGTRYRRGGTEPRTGFDCSGFTSWVYSTMGIDLPRSSQSQYLEGRKINKSQLQTGDLVFFKRKKRRISHVGIYLEDGKFIHSSSPGDTVKISRLDEPVWQRQWAGARRVIRY